jgi:hypothetical protein
MLACARLPRNILRRIGQNSQLNLDAPPCKQLMHLAARQICTERRLKLAFGRRRLVTPIFFGTNEHSFR